MGSDNDRQKAANGRRKKVPNRKGKPVPLYIHPTLFDRLKHCSAAIGSTHQGLIRLALREKLIEVEEGLDRGDPLMFEPTDGEIVLVK